MFYTISYPLGFLANFGSRSMSMPLPSTDLCATQTTVTTLITRYTINHSIYDGPITTKITKGHNIDNGPTATKITIANFIQMDEKKFKLMNFITIFMNP